jgi:aminoglycoside 6'-N-acetyltransferase I
MHIRTATEADLPQWAKLRITLWPWDTVADHAVQAAELYLAGHPDRAAFVALAADGSIVGFAEATLRRDYVEGCDTSPVAFLEGIFVAPGHRQQGIARALADRVGDWGRSLGCSEYGSNALIDNDASHAFHAAIGFAETLRVVYFRKDL